MPKLFISYRRKSSDLMYRIAERLTQLLDAEVFYDFAGMDSSDFERSLMKNLRESDVVLVIVTEHTFEPGRIHRDDDWVRREIAEALRLEKPITLVLYEGLTPPSDLPDDIRDIRKKHGLAFYRESWFFEPGIQELVNFLCRSTVLRRKEIMPSPPVVIADEPDMEEQPPSLRDQFFGALGDLEDAPDKALFVFETLHKAGYQPSYRKLTLDELIEEAREAAQQRQARQEAALEYDDILELVRRRVTRRRGLQELADWAKAHPKYAAELDTDGLLPLLAELEPPPAPPKPRFTLSLLEWMSIPAGKVALITEDGWRENYIPKGQPPLFDVPVFAMAKYPTTNAQYVVFMQDGGYSERGWWTSAGWAAKERDKWTQPRYWENAHFNGVEQPVVGVSWYEAVAFCAWLSNKLGEQVFLPTEQQWQRTAQGDDSRLYAWGSEWDCTRCNNSVNPCKRNTTTSVRQYEKVNASPFGVVDMTGNVWEWCMTTSDTGLDNRDAKGRRMIRGGACWNSNSSILCVTYRDNDTPINRGFDLGFRCARSAPA
ncbi:MAG: SUMF1/EgtB/PvdO family nonheme iron enzyme [Anaerolineae bacterium]|nr:SUMF1/EgtB/PvdO family nonheme iron enzyme [Anaerolineae bacterium]